MNEPATVPVSGNSLSCLGRRRAAPRIASLNSSPPTSATRTRAAPMRARPSNSSLGWRRAASRSSRRSRACMSPPISSSCKGAIRADREAALGGVAPFVRLARHRPDHADQSRGAVRGPRHIVRRGKTPVLDPQEARQLIDAIDTTTVIGLRDRALIGLMVYSFARIGAAIGMRVEDVYTQNRRLWVRLHEKGGKRHAMPCHHNLEAYLHAYIDGAGLGASRRRFCSRPTAARPANSPATPCPKRTPMR